MDKKNCAGCYNNFYNDNNYLGVKECWHLKGAKLVKKKKVHMNDVPPWKQPPITVPNCYKQVDYVFVGPDQEC